ncbi:MFS transporter [Paenibacillus sp. F6_3S_P_1C]|uniref:MFS transporter n=1 Tax=Paenibacillus vandeheii TaxID=3035917 RepID=A0ABT8J7F7_9BACL|nr:MFS transporter [Paenibacillus vandeheii]MDN4600960.1 MFS transporter [Paenibacillus vandeheii]
MKRMLWVIFVMAIGTTFPTPLFPIYQEQFHLSNLEITFLFAVYAIFLLPSLLVAGQIGIVYGLKKITMIGIISSIISIILFIIGTSAWQLYLSRILEGIGFGLFMGTATNLLLKKSPKEMTSKALTLSSMGVMVGFGVGPAISGLIIQYIHFQQLRFPFVTLLLLLISATIFLVSIPDNHQLVNKKEPMRIKISIPRDIRSDFWSFIGLTGFIVFSLNGIVISIIPTYVKTVLHTSNLSISGLLILLLLGGGGLAQRISWPQRPVIRIRIGIILQLIGAWLMVIAGISTNIVLLWMGIFIQAIGGGWSFQASLQLAGIAPKPEDRSKVISAYYFASYSGFIFPIVGVGLLNLFFDLSQSLTILNALATIIVILLVVLSFKPSILKLGYSNKRKEGKVDTR